MPTGTLRSVVHAPEDSELPKAAIFDVDGTLLDSVDLHALAWHEAMVKFGHDVGFEQARGQIGKGGHKLIPHFLSEDAQRDAATRPCTAERRTRGPADPFRGKRGERRVSAFLPFQGSA